MCKNYKSDQVASHAKTSNINNDSDDDDTGNEDDNDSIKFGLLETFIISEPFFVMVLASMEISAAFSGIATDRYGSPPLTDTWLEQIMVISRHDPRNLGGLKIIKIEMT